MLFRSENVVNLSKNPLEYKEKYLVSNADYKPVIFSDKLEERWMIIGGNLSETPSWIL